MKIVTTESILHSSPPQKMSVLLQQQGVSVPTVCTGMYSIFPSEFTTSCWKNLLERHVKYYYPDKITYCKSYVVD